jgi:hypothetical protein
MTDEDLIHHLRHSKGWPTLGNAAADRIEALRAALDEAEAEARDAHLQSLASMGQATEAHDAQLKAEAELHHWRQAASKGSIHTQADDARAERDALAEKLGRAVTSLSWYHDQMCEGLCKDLRYDSTYTTEMDDECAGCKARATLAAIKEKADE